MHKNYENGELLTREQELCQQIRKQAETIKDKDAKLKEIQDSLRKLISSRNTLKEMLIGCNTNIQVHDSFTNGMIRALKIVEEIVDARSNEGDEGDSNEGN